MAVARWDNVRKVAPGDVKVALDEAHTEARKLKARYEREAAVAQRRGPCLEKLGRDVDAAAAKALAFEAAHVERQRWYKDTIEVRERAQEARVELARRHPERIEVAAEVLREDMTELQAMQYDQRQINDLRRQRESLARSGLGVSL